MNIYEIILISISLSLDAFAVSITHGLKSKKINIKKMIIISICFGSFQFIMPTIGFLFCSLIQNYIIKIDHFIASFLLFFIGINMIINKDNNSDVNVKSLFFESIATSIDALVIGIVYKCSYTTNSLITFIFIGLITFINSTIGYLIGYKNNKIKYNPNMIGGIILIILGIKILLEHLL